MRTEPSETPPERWPPSRLRNGGLRHQRSCGRHKRSEAERSQGDDGIADCQALHVEPTATTVPEHSLPGVEPSRPGYIPMAFNTSLKFRPAAKT